MRVVPPATIDNAPSHVASALDAIRARVLELFGFVTDALMQLLGMLGDALEPMQMLLCGHLRSTGDSAVKSRVWELPTTTHSAGVNIHTASSTATSTHSGTTTTTVSAQATPRVRAATRESWGASFDMTSTSTRPRTSTLATGMATRTRMPTTRTATPTRTTTAATRTATATATATPIATATTTRTRTRASTTSPSTTRTLTGRIWPRPPREMWTPSFTQADRDRLAAERRRQYAADFAAAQAPQSIAEMMRSNAQPPPPPVEQLEREALLFPASRPRHDYFEIVAAGAPRIPSTPPGGVLPVFDDLLLPTHQAALPPAQERLLLREYTRMPFLQSSLAQERVNLAVVRARGSPPPTTESSVQCGCGWCPDGTAAYPLCAAVTMRRMMRSFGKRAATSHAGDAARRQSATAHRRDTAVAVMAGGCARG